MLNIMMLGGLCVYLPILARMQQFVLFRPFQETLQRKQIAGTTKALVSRTIVRAGIGS